MSAFEWRYKRRDPGTGQIIQEDWRPRPEGWSIWDCYNHAVATHEGEYVQPHQVESRPSQVAST